MIAKCGCDLFFRRLVRSKTGVHQNWAQKYIKIWETLL
jgi:hypothetical protein